MAAFPADVTFPVISLFWGSVDIGLEGHSETLPFQLILIFSVHWFVSLDA